MMTPWIKVWSLFIFCSCLTSGRAFEFAFSPVDGTGGGYGIDHPGGRTIYQYFHVNKPIQVTDLCRLQVQPSESEHGSYQLGLGVVTNEQPSLDGKDLLQLPVNFVNSNSVELASYVLNGDGYGGHMLGQLIVPIILQPGNYAFSMVEIPDPTSGVFLWYFNPDNFRVGPGVSLLPVGVNSVTFGGTFTYDLVPEAPQLNITSAGDAVVLAWDRTFSNAVLQASANISNPNGWADVLQKPNTNATSYIVSQPATNTAMFFRLR